MRVLNYLKRRTFRHFNGGWEFDDLGDGSKNILNWNLNLRINYLITLGPFFEDICEMMVNAFVKGQS